MSSERQSGYVTDRWWGEHIHRYNEALALINPTDNVLDIACGTGFGTDELAAKTKGRVIGADIAADAIQECRNKWKRDNMSFEVVDGTKMTYGDHYFDVVVSFETIEHTKQYREMLAEFNRVLKPGGKLILSTPNSAITSPNGVIGNPFHTQEFNYDELNSLLSEVFPQVNLMGQRSIRYDNISMKKRTGKLFETLFLGFGVRKLPLSWRTRFMSGVFGYPLYMRETDFTLEKNMDRVKKECPVLFAICQK